MHCRIGLVIVLATVSVNSCGLVSSLRTGIDMMLDLMFSVLDSLVDCSVICLCFCRFVMCSKEFNRLLHMLSRRVRYLARARECNFACWLAGSPVSLSGVTGRGPLGVPSSVSALCLYDWVGESVGTTAVVC